MCDKHIWFNINKSMEFEDSRYALFPEPNAYIQKFNIKKEDKEIKKIVFQEPYETLPNYHLNNNFTKHDCDCVSKSKFGESEKGDCGYNKKNSSSHNNNCNNNNTKQHSFGLDLKGLLPILGLLNKGGADLGNLVGLLSNNSNSENLTGSMGLISNLMSNKDIMGGLLNLFKGGGLNFFNKKPQTKKELKTTDFEIKNYTRVE